LRQRDNATIFIILFFHRGVKGVFPLQIGSVYINGYAALAPMAGVADRAFRELCIEYGAVYVVGEMASAKGISLGGSKSRELLLLTAAERPAAVQLFGEDPAVMAQAARQAMAYGPDIIDLNMGCPAPKIAGNGGGAALMRRPELAAAITAACVQSVPVPVTVKMRLGWDAEHLNAVELARLCERAGAAAVTVHGRTKAQMYAPPVDLDRIREVRRAISIPLIGNGDVIDGPSAQRMFDETGCNLVMVGRGALGRPWVFRQIQAYLSEGTILPEPPLPERMDVMTYHIEQLCAYNGEFLGMRQARKHAAWYMKGIRGAARYRQEIGALSSLEELRALAKKVISNSEQLM